MDLVSSNSRVLKVCRVSDRSSPRQLLSWKNAAINPVMKSVFVAHVEKVTMSHMMTFGYVVIFVVGGIVVFVNV